VRLLPGIETELSGYCSCFDHDNTNPRPNVNEKINVLNASIFNSLLIRGIRIFHHDNDIKCKKGTSKNE